MSVVANIVGVAAGSTAPTPVRADTTFYTQITKGGPLVPVKIINGQPVLQGQLQQVRSADGTVATFLVTQSLPAPANATSKPVQEIASTAENASDAVSSRSVPKKTGTSKPLMPKLHTLARAAPPAPRVPVQIQSLKKQTASIKSGPVKTKQTASRPSRSRRRTTTKASDLSLERSITDVVESVRCSSGETPESSYGATFAESHNFHKRAPAALSSTSKLHAISLPQSTCNTKQTPQSRSNAFLRCYESDVRLTQTPDCTTGFRSYEDAVYRLLPFHIHNDRLSQQDYKRVLETVDEDFSKSMLSSADRCSAMLERFQHILLRNAAHSRSHVGELQIARLQRDEEQMLLDAEKAPLSKPVLSSLSIDATASTSGGGRLSDEFSPPPKLEPMVDVHLTEVATVHDTEKPSNVSEAQPEPHTSECLSEVKKRPGRDNVPAGRIERPAAARTRRSGVGHTKDHSTLARVESCHSDLINVKCTYWRQRLASRRSIFLERYPLPKEETSHQETQPPVESDFDLEQLFGFVQTASSSSSTPGGSSSYILESVTDVLRSPPRHVLISTSSSTSALEAEATSSDSDSDDGSIEIGVGTSPLVELRPLTTTTAVPSTFSQSPVTTEVDTASSAVTPERIESSSEERISSPVTPSHARSDDLPSASPVDSLAQPSSAASPVHSRAEPAPPPIILKLPSAAIRTPRPNDSPAFLPDDPMPSTSISAFSIPTGPVESLCTNTNRPQSSTDSPPPPVPSSAGYCTSAINITNWAGQERRETDGTTPVSIPIRLKLVRNEDDGNLIAVTGEPRLAPVRIKLGKIAEPNDEEWGKKKKHKKHRKHKRKRRRSDVDVEEEERTVPKLKLSLSNVKAKEEVRTAPRITLRLPLPTSTKSSGVEKTSDPTRSVKEESCKRKKPLTPVYEGAERSPDARIPVSPSVYRHTHAKKRLLHKHLASEKKLGFDTSSSNS